MDTTAPPSMGASALILLGQTLHAAGFFARSFSEHHRKNPAPSSWPAVSRPPSAPPTMAPRDPLLSPDKPSRELLHTPISRADSPSHWAPEPPYWPLTLSPSSYLATTTRHHIKPLIVMLSPPPNADAAFSEAVKDLENALRQLLLADYDPNSPTRPVNFRAKAWKPDNAGGESATEALFHTVAHHDCPTLIVDLELTADDLAIHMHYWGLGLVGEAPFLTHLSPPCLPLSRFIADVVRPEVVELGALSERLGVDIFVNDMDRHNWDVLKKERLVAAETTADAARQRYEKHYRYDANDLRDAMRRVVPALQLLVASFADMYHLLRYQTPPQLPTMLQKHQDSAKDATVVPMLRQILLDYALVCDTLSEAAHVDTSLLHLQLAHAALWFDEHALTATLLAQSLRAWAVYRHAIAPDDRAATALTPLLAPLITLATPQDLRYLQQLHAILEAMTAKTTPSPHDDAQQQLAQLLAALATAPPPAKPPRPAIHYLHGWSTDRVRQLQQQTAQALDVPVFFEDRLSSRHLGPRLTVIPAGEFDMGSPDHEPERCHNEHFHRVRLASPFALGIYPITVAEFTHFVTAAGYRTDAERHHGGYYWTGSEWRKDRDVYWRHPRFNQHPNAPVVCVSWFDALAYCEWLSQQTGATYRLPTEAEWEYACRAGTTTAFWWGQSVHTHQANYDGQFVYHQGSVGEFRRQTVTVDHFPQANPWGLYQMHGNVWEWTASLYKTPYDGRECRAAAPEDRGSRVLRGGAWCGTPLRLRSASRGDFDPSGCIDYFGCRVVRDFS